MALSSWMELVCEVAIKLYKCCAPSSDLPSLKTGLPHLLTKPWSEVGVLVLRPVCPIFRQQVLPQLLTKSEDDADSTSDLPQLKTIKYHLYLLFYFKKFKYKHKFYSFKIIFLFLKAQIIQIQPHQKHIYIKNRKSTSCFLIFFGTGLSWMWRTFLRIFGTCSANTFGNSARYWAMCFLGLTKSYSESSFPSSKH